MMNQNKNSSALVQVVVVDNLHNEGEAGHLLQTFLFDTWINIVNKKVNGLCLSPMLSCLRHLAIVQRRHLTERSTVLVLFTEIFDYQVFTSPVTFINDYANEKISLSLPACQHSVHYKWAPLTKSELYKLIVLPISMGITKKPTIKIILDYWPWRGVWMVPFNVQARLIWSYKSHDAACLWERIWR